MVEGTPLRSSHGELLDICTVRLKIVTINTAFKAMWFVSSSNNGNFCDFSTAFERM